ncbi:MAG: hypothetical protein JNL21_14625 [Myxococcales bacterium]|nr:hypothetical protein [Myxococcales bacterium]
MSPERIFVDRLFEKHECGPERVEAEGARQVLVEGATVHVLFPKYVPSVEVVSAAKQGDLLFLVGLIQAPPEWGVAGNGAIVVARRMQDDLYGVHVWHELHQGTLEHLVESRDPGSEARYSGVRLP